MKRFGQFVKTLGPGLLYAGAAIGVSHLVQSTRAGASYYFDLVWILLLVNLVKYPFFEFSPRYSIATGNSLIQGYQRIGKWAVVLFAFFTLTTMFAIQAAVTIVTAGIGIYIFNTEIPVPAMSAILLGTTMILLITGRYSLLDRMIKIVIAVLAVSTLLAVISALGNNPGMTREQTEFFRWDHRLDILFLIAFVGWMPAPIDVSVWQSIWTVAKKRSDPGIKQDLTDFRIGYIGTVIIALAFLTLGALVMHGTGEVLSSRGAVFAEQLINMYTASIGRWTYPVIAIAAFTTMYSTTLTCIDAYPRVLQQLTGALIPSAKKDVVEKPGIYWFWLVIMVAGSLAFITFLADSMQFMVDVATTLSFITAPVIAYLNYRVVTDRHMPEEHRPGRLMRISSWIGIIFFALFTLFWMTWRLSEGSFF